MQLYSICMARGLTGQRRALVYRMIPGEFIASLEWWPSG